MTEAATTRYAVVTGANKGIGLEICNQLASNGITVVVTSRDEKRGLEAVEKLKGQFGHSDSKIMFHQLDVVDPLSVASFADFLKTKLGKLDILINNAGHGGTEVNQDGLAALRAKHVGMAWEDVLMAQGEHINWGEILVESYDSAQQCIQTNYYGPKRLTEALIPLLKLSDSPRIVNVSSSMGKLQKIPNEWAKGILSDVENLTEEKVDEVITEFLKDFKEGLVHAKNWPNFMTAYVISKTALNAYTRILAKSYPTISTSAICPGFVKTDINFNTGTLTVEQGAESAVKIALLPHGGPSGLFYYRGELTSYE